MRGIAGIILLGGASRRFGRPKGLVELGGTPLLARVIERTGTQTWPLALATGACAEAPPGIIAARGLPCLDDDRFAGAGPLAGIRAGLAWLATEGGMPDWLFSTPVDVPFLPVGLAPALREAALAAGGSSAYAVTGTQHHAAIAVWHRRALRDLDELLAQGPAPVMAAHDRLGGAPLVRDDAEAFLNVNTPEDLERAAGLLGQAVARGDAYGR